MVLFVVRMFALPRLLTRALSCGIAGLCGIVGWHCFGFVRHCRVSCLRTCVCATVGVQPDTNVFCAEVECCCVIFRCVMIQSCERIPGVSRAPPSRLPRVSLTRLPLSCSFPAQVLEIGSSALKACRFGALLPCVAIARHHCLDGRANIQMRI